MQTILGNAKNFKIYKIIIHKWMDLLSVKKKPIERIPTNVSTKILYIISNNLTVFKTV